MKRYRKVLALVACILGTLFMVCIERYLVLGLSTQQLAGRWSKEEDYAQLACYFTKETAFSPDRIPELERAFVQSLEEAALGSTNEKGGRSWLDAYSAQGELFISSNRSSMNARVFGVGGDFFQFHPLTLLNGSYFDASDENEDGVILDEIVAWQLFGSSNISGMEVEINGRIYPVRGVVRSDSGLFSDAVNEEAATVYVSFAVFEECSGGEAAIDSYELLIANPVKKFGKNALETALGMEESEYELVEVSARFDFLHRLNILKNFGIRSMNTKNIVYPYWENRARGYEDISALFLVLEAVCLGYPLFWLLQKCRRFWKCRKMIKARLRSDSINFFKNLFMLLKNTVKTYKLVNKK